MKKIVLTLKSVAELTDYVLEHFVTEKEVKIVNEILESIKAKDERKLKWFNQFGSSIHHIIRNVNHYRHAVEFGFDTIKINEYGWLEHPEFLEKEKLEFGGSPDTYNHSEVRIGKGINGIWTYSLSYSFGTAGGSGALSVFDPKYVSRDAATEAGVTELKNLMLAKVGNSDTSNYNPKVIKRTLRDIDKYLCNSIQLSLF